MKPRCANRQNHALTLVEVLVTIVVLAVLAVIILPMLAHHSTRKVVECADNLKQMGISFQMWQGNHNDRYPFELSVTNGGTMELNNGRNAWLNFLVMSNELSTPKILLCPQDNEHPPAATSFSWQLAGHVSYFIGLDSKESNPQGILSGDDNFEIGGLPVKSGLLEISSNTAIAWSAARHKRTGYFLLADGSVQGMNNSVLTNWPHRIGAATNRLAIP